MSLKDSLFNLIKSRGQLSYSEMVNICLQEGMKISNGERRMRELCKEENIEPIMARSKRGTEYISGWRMKKSQITLAGLDKLYSNITNGQKPDMVGIVNEAGNFVTIKLPPAFAPKKQKEVQDRLI